MTLFDEYKISELAFRKWEVYNPDRRIIDLITHSQWACQYCLVLYLSKLEDKMNIYSRITNSEDIAYYKYVVSIYKDI